MPIPHDGPGHDRQDPSPGWGPPPSGWDRQPLPAAGPAPVPPPQLPPPQKPGVIALRPLGFGDLLDGTFAVIRLAPIPTLLNAVLAQLLPALTAVLLLAALAPRVEVGVEVGPGLPLPPGLLQELEEAWPGYALGLVIYLLVQLVAGVLVIGPSTVAAMRATLGQRTGWGQALALSARAMPRLAVWNLLIAAALSVVGVLAVAGTVLAASQLGLAVALALLLPAAGGAVRVASHQALLRADRNGGQVAGSRRCHGLLVAAGSRLLVADPGDLVGGRHHPGPVIRARHPDPGCALGTIHHRRRGYPADSGCQRRHPGGGRCPVHGDGTDHADAAAC